MKIIDSFIFYNEIDLLKARLNYLGDFVDSFIISEANVNFAGQEKNYQLESILQDLPHNNKIFYQKASINFIKPEWIYKKLRYLGRPHKFSWKIQDFQRNSIQNLIKKRGLLFDILLFGDLDEFPNLETLKKLKKINFDNVTTFNQKSFYYNLETYQPGETWPGTIWIPFKDLNKNHLHKWRSDREKFPLTRDGGFHFSYFMTPDLITKKINAIASSEKLSNIYLNINLESITKKIQQKEDLFDRNLNFRDSSFSLPPDLKDLILKYLPYCKTGSD